MMDVNPGNPQAGFPQSGQYPHAKPSWLGRNWLWFVPLILLLLGSPFICCGGCVWLGYSMFKAPVEGVVEYANNDPRITDVIGSPITSGSNFSINNYTNNNGTGSAELAIDLVGPKGTAQIEGTVRGVNNVWTPENMTVTFPDGSTITVPE